MRTRALLLHPVPLAAAALLFLNDHWLKYAFVMPRWLTGKLSDFAGLFLFPIVCVAVFVRGRTIVCALTGILFTAIKLHPLAHDAAERLLGPIARDPSDLLALPMLLASWLWLRRPPRPFWDSRRAHIAALSASALACVATSPSFVVRNYPRWETDAGEERVGCAAVQIWMARTGKEGMGVGLELRNLGDAGDEDCTIQIETAGFEIAGSRIPARSLPAPTQVPPGQTRQVYLPFAFDGNRLWNDGRRTGTLTVAVAAGNARRDVAVALVERLNDFHRTRRRR